MEPRLALNGSVYFHRRARHVDSALSEQWKESRRTRKYSAMKNTTFLSLALLAGDQSRSR